MSSELDFELLTPRLPWRRLVVVATVCFACLVASAVSVWQSYASLTAARAELQVAQERAKNSIAKSPPPLPPYYDDARAALELLQWPFDKSLTEMESCLPDDAQLESLRIDALSRQTNAVLKMPVNGSAGSFGDLLECLNDGQKLVSWRLSTLERSGRTGADAAPNETPGSAEKETLTLKIERREAER